MTAAARGPHVIRDMNRVAVLDAVRGAGGGVNVATLTQRTGLSRPAVTRALADLANAALVRVVDPVPGSAKGAVGRPAQHVRFHARLGYVAGLDVGPRRVHAVLADLDNVVVGEADAEIVPEQDDVLAVAQTALARCLRESGVDATDLWAVAVGSPGLVDAESGVVGLAPSIPGWAGLPVATSLRERLGCDVLVDNDMNLGAMSEYDVGVASSHSDPFVYVHWGERIGSGIVIKGEPFRGASSAAGELGFLDLVLEADDERPATPAVDGAGAFERWVGAGAVRDLALRIAVEEASEPLGRLAREVAVDDFGAELVALAGRGDPAADRVCDVMTRRFAAGLAALVVLVDPGLVMIGGSMARAGEPLLARLRDALRGRLLTTPEIRLARRTDDAVAIGAIRLALTVAERRLARMAADSG